MGPNGSVSRPSRTSLLVARATRSLRVRSFTKVRIFLNSASMSAPVLVFLAFSTRSRSQVLPADLSSRLNAVRQARVMRSSTPTISCSSLRKRSSLG